MPKMAKTKAIRNMPVSRPRGRFKIGREPVVRFGAAVQSSDLTERISLSRVLEEPMLFAIARDQHSIFVSWNIDWLSAFGEAVPVDRQVHLRLISDDGFEQER